MIYVERSRITALSRAVDLEDNFSLVAMMKASIDCKSWFKAAFSSWEA
jgi:hypothetical protein